MSGERKRTSARECVLFVRVTSDEHERVRLAADKAGVSASDFIRIAFFNAVRSGATIGGA